MMPPISSSTSRPHSRARPAKAGSPHPALGAADPAGMACVLMSAGPRRSAYWLKAGRAGHVGPGVAHVLLHAGRQRHVLQRLGDAGAVVEGPVEEPHHRGAARGVLRVHRQQHEGGRDDRPGALARGVEQVDGEVLRVVPVGGGGGLGEAGQVRRDVGAGAVLQLHRGEAVLAGIGVLDVADAALGVAHGGGDAVIALGAGADRPGDRGGGADLGLPVGTGLGEVGGEHEGRARPVGAVHRRHRGVRQLHARVEGGDLRIVPAGDVAGEQAGQHRAGEVQLVRGDAGQVDDRHHAAHHGRELQQVVGCRAWPPTPGRRRRRNPPCARSPGSGRRPSPAPGS